MEKELLNILEEYVACCEKFPVKTGLVHPMRYHDNGTCSVEEIVSVGVEPTFTSFIEWLRIRNS